MIVLAWIGALLLVSVVATFCIWLLIDSFEDAKEFLIFVAVVLLTIWGVWGLAFLADHWSDKPAAQELEAK